MRKLVILLLLFSSVLLANSSSAPEELSSLQGDASALILDCVNAITGDLVFDQYDAIVKGVEPLPFRRRYISREIQNPSLVWSPFYHIYAYVEIDDFLRVYVKEPNGIAIRYDPLITWKLFRPETTTCFPVNSQFTSGIINQSGYTPIENVLEFSLETLVLHQSNLSYRVYKCLQHNKLPVNKHIYRYYLDHERLPNGNFIRYVYGPKEEEYRLKEIYTTNPSQTITYARITIDSSAHEKHRHSYHTLKTSDNHELHYKMAHYLLPKKPGAKKNNSLHSIKHASTVNYPKENRSYNDAFLLESRSFPEGRKLTATYDKKHRVTQLTGPNGPLCKIKYNKGRTEVIDADQNRTYYFYDPQTLRLQRIDYFHSTYEPLKIVTFEWDKNGYLVKKSTLNPHTKPLLTTTYTYDKKYNLSSKTLIGPITGHNSEEQYTLSYTYDKNNRLLTQTEDNGKITTYTYLENTNLPLSKTLFKDNLLLKRTLYTYNEDNILIREITDDGPDYSERHIKTTIPRTSQPYYGLPEIIEEQYENGQDIHLLKKTHLTYDQWGNVTTKTIYDANNQARYTLTTLYNERGQITEETDPLGNKTTYTYDANGNKRSEQTSQGLLTNCKYDTSNRLIKHTTSGSGHIYTSSYGKFTSHNQPKTSSNPLGGITHHSYDGIGRLTRIHDSTGATTTYTYNALDQKISTRDPRSHTTLTRYNIYGSPLTISHPDETEEHYTYNLDGTKASYTDQNGITTFYTYDIYGNITEEEIPESDFQISRTYNAFHLLSETNAEGHTTNYTYNSAGQLTSKTYADRTTFYTYDSMGRQATETTCDYTIAKTYDPLDRVIEEKELSDDTLLSHTLIEYNDPLRTKTITTFPDNTPAHNQITYDPFQREILQIDPLGNTYTTEYQLIDGILQKTLTEPEQIRSIETYNDLNQLLSIEKQAPDHTPLSHIDYTYDPSGNKILEATTVYKETTPTSTHTISYTYDSLNRKITQTESNQRTLFYTYTPTGLLQTLTTPNQVTFTYTYNPLGHQIALFSSDHSINYTYIRNKLGQLLSANDGTTRILDAHGNILQETLANDYTLFNTYDPMGRRTHLQLPHQSISYTYEGPRLTSVSFDSLIHTYIYDLANNLTSSTRIDQKTNTYTFDTLSRPTHLSAFPFTQSRSYTPRGNIDQITHNHISKTYTYDLLDHLTQEPDHHYTYDSLHNRHSKNNASYTVSPLNQVTHTSSANYIYDTNGNLIQKNDTLYTYDALDRLTSVSTLTATTTYTYDIEHRRLTKNTEKYIWDDQHELGTPNYYRILGSTPEAEIGSAVALYLNNIPHVPIHDLQGNLIQVLNLDSVPVETQTFTAFGEGATHIPWGFSSKRHDPETQLIYFGRRYYDPSLGRFITTDPEGYTDSANLYAYVLNNPLTHHDPYGLITTQYNPQWLNPNAEPYNPYKGYMDANPEDLYQVLVGGLHGIGQCTVDTALSLSKFLGGVHGTEDMRFLDTYNLSTQANQHFQNTSQRWLEDTLRADANNPFYTASYHLSYTGTDLAISALPFGSLTKAKRISQVAGTSAKASKTANRILQSTKTITKEIELGKKVWSSQKIATSCSSAVNHVLQKPANFGITPKNYFSGKSYSEMEKILLQKFGNPKGVGPYNQSFYNPQTGRTFNLHWDPTHRGGKPHIDIRKRGISSDYYKNRPFYLKQ